MTNLRVTLTGAQETLLITLAAKAAESLLPDSLLHDRFAAEAVARIDYDFGKLDIDRDLMVAFALRSHLLDTWTRDFLARHSEAVVLHLGCGLDSRVFRIDPGPGVRWFELDFPEVVALRRRLYPRRAGARLIGTSLTDTAWLARIPNDRPRLILAEGVLPYVPAEEVLPLLDRLTADAPRGEIAFDAYSRFGLQMIRDHRAIRATGAELHWFLEDPLEIEHSIPRLRMAQELRAYAPEGCDAAQIARLSPQAQWTALACRFVPELGKVGRLLRYTF